jgi:hypothetical protein
MINETYLVWWSFDKNKPKKISLKFTFPGLKPVKEDKAKPLEKVLGLIRQ